MKHAWADFKMRNQIIDFISHWHQRSGFSKHRLLRWLGVSSSTYHHWCKRADKPNQHNGKIPKAHWLLAWERARIIDYAITKPEEGYRRLTYQMMDANIVAVSPSSVYRVLKSADLIRRWNGNESKKGTGFHQPTGPHQHWHTDIAYLNICGTFYYLCTVIDGYSRYVVHWEIREQMKEVDVEIILERALEKTLGVTPRLITDNGPQFVAKDMKMYLREKGLKHVRTSPYYPQSNGKIERWHKTLKTECVRKETPLNLDDARMIVARYVKVYNTQRLHSAIGYITPADKLNGKAPRIFEARKQKLACARERRLCEYQAKAS